jgi:DNA replication initiation complex subunit (GINS family)
VGQIAAASDEELDEMIAELRPAIDYSFFEVWTARIEQLTQQGNTAEAERLTARRAYILERVEQMDKEAQELFEASANVLREVLAADDPEAVLRANSERLDDAFMLVLSANVASAQRAGQDDLAARLEEISRMAIEIIQENLTPEERLINQLLMAPTNEESSALLRSNAAQVTPDFVKRMNEMADQQDKEGVKAAAERLRRLAREASSLLY